MIRYTNNPLKRQIFSKPIRNFSSTPAANPYPAPPTKPKQQKSSSVLPTLLLASTAVVAGTGYIIYEAETGSSKANLFLSNYPQLQPVRIQVARVLELTKVLPPNRGQAKETEKKKPSKVVESPKSEPEPVQAITQVEDQVASQPEPEVVSEPEVAVQPEVVAQPEPEIVAEPEVSAATEVKEEVVQEEVQEKTEENKPVETPFLIGIIDQGQEATYDANITPPTEKFDPSAESEAMFAAAEAALEEEKCKYEELNKDILNNKIPQVLSEIFLEESFNATNNAAEKELVNSPFSSCASKAMTSWNTFQIALHLENEASNLKINSDDNKVTSHQLRERITKLSADFLNLITRQSLTVDIILNNVRDSINSKYESLLSTHRKELELEVQILLRKKLEELEKLHQERLELIQNTHNSEARKIIKAQAEGFYQKIEEAVAKQTEDIQSEMQSQANEIFNNMNTSYLNHLNFLNNEISSLIKSVSDYESYLDLVLKELNNNKISSQFISKVEQLEGTLALPLESTTVVKDQVDSLLSLSSQLNDQDLTPLVNCVLKNLPDRVVSYGSIGLPELQLRFAIAHQEARKIGLSPELTLNELKDQELRSKEKEQIREKFYSDLKQKFNEGFDKKEIDEKGEEISSNIFTKYINALSSSVNYISNYYSDKIIQNATELSEKPVDYVKEATVTLVKNVNDFITSPLVSYSIGSLLANILPKPKGHISGEGIEETLARAEYYLTVKGDIEGSLNELKTLKNPSVKLVLNDFETLANDRLQVDQTIKILKSSILIQNSRKL